MSKQAAVDWTALREEFPITKRWAFFDHAAVAPLTARAQRAVADWAAELADNGPVHHGRWMQRIEEVRGLAAQLLGADPLDVAFIKNTSEGVGIVAEGFPWRAGDNVVIAEEEYPANVYPWLNLAERGVDVRTVPSRERRIEIDDIRAAMDAKTRIVSLSAVEFASGFRNDLDHIGQLCREKDALFFVDAIQSLGACPLSVKQSPIDFLAADGHKWLLGPEGAGIFYIRRDLLDMLHSVGVGWNSVVSSREFSTIDFRLKPHAGRWESGSYNVAGITGLGASLELLLQIGIPEIWERILSLTDHACEQLQRVGLEIYSSRRAQDKSGIVSIVSPTRDPRGLVRRLRAEGVVINQRAGRLRISPHCYNSTAELDRLIALLKDTK